MRSAFYEVKTLNGSSIAIKLRILYPFLGFKLSSFYGSKFKAYNQRHSKWSEESKLNYLDKYLALQPFKVDSSHPLIMTAIAQFYTIPFYGYITLNLMVLEKP